MGRRPRDREGRAPLVGAALASAVSLALPALLGLLALLASAATGPVRAQAGGATLAGTVSDTSGAPVPAAQVVLAGSGRAAFTDSAGRFRVRDFPPGRYEVRVRRVGFQPLSFDVVIEDGTSAEVRITIAPNPPPVLPTVAVSAEVRRARMAGFYERARRAVGGVFLDRDMIERRSPANLSSLVLTVPGLTVDRDARGEALILSRPMGFRRCPITIFVDGMLMGTSGREVDQIVPVSAIEAVEVYPSANSVPREFAQRSAVTECAEAGVIVIWTRMPDSRRRPK